MGLGLLGQPVLGYELPHLCGGAATVAELVFQFRRHLRKGLPIFRQIKNRVHAKAALPYAFCRQQAAHATYGDVQIGLKTVHGRKMTVHSLKLCFALFFFV